MLAYITMCAVLALIAAVLTNEMVKTGGFWGALIMTGVFGAITAAVANASC